MNLSVDILARNGAALRITAHQTDAGHIELENPLEVAERRPDDSFQAVAAYTVRSFLSAADDQGEVTLDGRPDLVIEGHWTTTVSDWLQMLAEDLTRSLYDTSPTA